jgi:hypothetical protein
LKAAIASSGFGNAGRVDVAVGVLLEIVKRVVDVYPVDLLEVVVGQDEVDADPVA